MTNAVQCCEAAGIAPPASALQLVAPTPPMMTPSPPNSVITPPPPPHIPGESMEEEDLGEGSVENMVSIGCRGRLNFVAFFTELSSGRPLTLQIHVSYLLS